MSPKGKGVELAMFFWRHDFSERCICSRCGAVEVAPILSDPKRPWTFIELRYVKAIEQRLSKHRLDGCVCIDCGQRHAWVLIQQDEYDDERSFEALYTEVFVCVLCGEIIRQQEWDEYK